jgi:hypothetical protein
MIAGVLVGPPSRSHDCVSAQSGLEFQEGQRYLKQPFSELLIGNTGIRTVSHKRRHERAAIVVPFQAS